MEGVSDLRRFWNGRSQDFTCAELVAFMATLPDESATSKVATDSEVGIETLLLASILDTLRQTASGQAGKKFPKDKLIAPSLSRESRRKKEKDRELVERLKKSLQKD